MIGAGETKVAKQEHQVEGVLKKAKGTISQLFTNKSRVEREFSQAVSIKVKPANDSTLSGQTMPATDDQFNIIDLLAAITKMQERIDKLEAESDVSKDKLENLGTQLAAKDREIQTMRAEAVAKEIDNLRIFKKGNDDLSALRETSEKHKERMDKVDEQLAAATENIDKTREELEQMSNAAVDLEKLVEVRTSALEGQLSTAKGALESQLKDLDTSLTDNVKEATRDLTEKINNVSAKTDDLQAKTEVTAKAILEYAFQSHVENIAVVAEIKGITQKVDKNQVKHQLTLEALNGAKEVATTAGLTDLAQEFSEAASELEDGAQLGGDLSSNE